jgi:hypothetical protein
MGVGVEDLETVARHVHASCIAAGARLLRRCAPRNDAIASEAKQSLFGQVLRYFVSASAEK